MKFEVSCQYAHHNANESVSFGSMLPDSVLRAFDEFDWQGQVIEANRLQGISPTFSVEDPSEKRLIWVSGYGKPERIKFVSECTVRRAKKVFFGLMERERAVEIGHTETFTRDQARRVLELFMSDSESELRSFYKNRENRS